MNKVCKDDVVLVISNSLHIPKSTVKSVIDAYLNRLRESLSKGETIKFLNICYIVNSNTGRVYKETLAYISSEIGTSLGISGLVVLRILQTYEDNIAKDVCKFYTHSVKGIVRFKRIEYESGVYKLRLNKATNLGSDFRVVTLNLFRRKVDSYDR